MAGRRHPPRPPPCVAVREVVDLELIPHGSVQLAVWAVPTDKAYEILMHVEAGGASPPWVVCQEADTVKHEPWDLQSFPKTVCTVCHAEWPCEHAGEVTESWPERWLSGVPSRYVPLEDRPRPVGLLLHLRETTITAGCDRAVRALPSDWWSPSRSYGFGEARLLALDLHELGLAEAWVVYRVDDRYNVREKLELLREPDGLPLPRKIVELCDAVLSDDPDKVKELCEINQGQEKT